MQRRALLRTLGVTAALGIAGCGGSQDGGETTTSTTSSNGSEGTPTQTQPSIDSSVSELKLRAAALPDDESWQFVQEDEDTTELERRVQTRGYLLRASVLAASDFETAVSTVQDERDRAEAYTGVSIEAFDVGVASFGYQLTSDSSTVILRDANVVGELRYDLDYDSSGDHSISLSTAADYAGMWHASWR